MTLATVPVAMFFLVPTLLITYIGFRDIEGSYFVDNPFGQELFYPAVFADWYRELASLIRAYGEAEIGSGTRGRRPAGGFAYDPDNHACISGAVETAAASAMVGVNECSIGPRVTRTK